MCKHNNFWKSKNQIVNFIRNFFQKNDTLDAHGNFNNCEAN